ncbi:glycoside hydrolase family 95-like protein [Zunongwangia sp.]|uniref:glycoside hydrolase family 95-like protein n=1 Tax=Zunongwangia sp. TaxID=1965325 RepID=UPI003AA8689B
MLLQSQDGTIHLLPALPEDWSKGEVYGLRAREGFEVALDWEKNKLDNVVIKSRLGGVRCCSNWIIYFIDRRGIRKSQR